MGLPLIPGSGSLSVARLCPMGAVPIPQSPPGSSHGTERLREPHGDRELRCRRVPWAPEPGTPRGAPRPEPPHPHPPPDGAGEARRNDRE